MLIMDSMLDKLAENVSDGTLFHFPVVCTVIVTFDWQKTFF